MKTTRISMGRREYERRPALANKCVSPDPPMGKRIGKERFRAFSVV
jgi:hypothetical protein